MLLAGDQAEKDFLLAALLPAFGSLLALNPDVRFALGASSAGAASFSTAAKMRLRDMRLERDSELRFRSPSSWVVLIASVGRRGVD
jgi:hypothetical protein